MRFKLRASIVYAPFFVKTPYFAGGGGVSRGLCIPNNPCNCICMQFYHIARVGKCCQPPKIGRFTQQIALLFRPLRLVAVHRRVFAI